MTIQTGAASVIITPPLGTQIQGAGIADQPAKVVRDQLEANAVYFRSDDQTVLLISCDVAVLTTDFVIATRVAIGDAIGLNDSDVIISATHTHSGPSVMKTDFDKPVEDGFLKTLCKQLIVLAKQAKQAAVPSKIGWGLGNAAVGYNRRCCWSDGSHSMHNPALRTDFTGFEGPGDPDHVAIFACDADGKLLAVIHQNTAHPTTFFSEKCFSSDFPGEARSHIRDSLGEIPVLFFNGALGDVCRRDVMTKGQVETVEQILKRCGHLLAGETLRLFHESPLHDKVAFGHVYVDMLADVRLPAPDRLTLARETISQMQQGKEGGGMNRIFAWGITSLQDEFGENPTDTLRLHVLRIGDVALVTQPTELYCQFGLDIKRRSPAPITAVCSVADGYAGYCPTLYSIIGGGYSGEAIQWCRFTPETGYKLVDKVSRLLRQLWPNE
ncbi:MAG: hypothetical protein JKX85_09725 [Phycisphaeraceae bacterium]|nr:hypothetical protein [Phycisphaeraceae bacterium]